MIKDILELISFREETVNSLQFDLSEYQTRLSSVHDLLAARNIDALVLTGEKNFRYLTGYRNQGWISFTRPRYLVVRAGEPPTAVIPSTNVIGFKKLSWVQDVLDWPSPQPKDDGISLLIEAITRGRNGKLRSVAIEMGPESRWQSTLNDLDAIKQKLAGMEFVDGYNIMMAVRARKSQAEITVMKKLCQMVSEVLDSTEGMDGLATEADVYHHFLTQFAENRVEQVPYLVTVSGLQGYEQLNTGPLDNALGDGVVLCVDAGCSLGGYMSDITRNYQYGEAGPQISEIYRRLYAATEAGLDAVKPGVTAADVFAAMNREAGSAVAKTPVGRMGHGIGLDVNEGLSISATDKTVLEPGMTLAIEPSIVFQSNGERRIMVHEENVAVTETGVELLSRRAPEEIHRIACPA